MGYDQRHYIGLWYNCPVRLVPFYMYIYVCTSCNKNTICGKFSSNSLKTERLDCVDKQNICSYNTYIPYRVYLLHTLSPNTTHPSTLRVKGIIKQNRAISAIAEVSNKTTNTNKLCRHSFLEKTSERSKP